MDDDLWLEDVLGRETDRRHADIIEGFDDTFGFVGTDHNPDGEALR